MYLPISKDCCNRSLACLSKARRSDWEDSTVYSSSDGNPFGRAGGKPLSAGVYRVPLRMLMSGYLGCPLWRQQTRTMRHVSRFPKLGFPSRVSYAGIAGINVL